MSENGDSDDVVFEPDEEAEKSVEDVNWTEYQSSSNFFKPEEEGEEIVGVVSGTEETQYGDAVVIKLRDGGEKLVNYQAINDDLKENQGELVRLIYQGDESGPNGHYKTFKLMVADQ
ncbi:MAG: hypothetical protein ABEJ56_05585 [Candidatus Nanohaloarchaea archaeon]